jgi:hypothetical protein
LNESAPTLEPLWKKVAPPLIVAAILAAASSAIGIFKLAYPSIPDPYTGNIYWEPSLKQSFAHREDCSFMAYRIVNESSKATEKPIKFDFEIYKRRDVHLKPSRLSRKNRPKQSTPATVQEDQNVLVIRSSEVETVFKIYVDKVVLWKANPAFEGWLRVIATLSKRVPPGGTVDIILYWSYAPLHNLRFELDALTINGVSYPNVDSNKKLRIQQKQLIAQQKEAFSTYLILFLLLVVLAFLASVWFVKTYAQHRTKRAQIKRKLEELAQIKQRGKKESELDKDFVMTEVDEEATDGSNQKPSENGANQIAGKPIKTVKKKKKKTKKKKTLNDHIK